MDRWLGLGLLLAGVVAVVVPRRAHASWALPLAAAVIDVALGVASTTRAWTAVKALLPPVAFLLCAVPMSVLLDRMGLFSALAQRAQSRRTQPGPVGGAGYLWALSALVTTFLNLDASVVLLTPLYVAIARQRGQNELLLGVQPVLLACLASSALPVSNLTNLIAASWTGAATGQFVAHLALPSLVATGVGWLAYRWVACRQAGRTTPSPGALASSPGSRAEAGTARVGETARAGETARVGGTARVGETARAGETARVGGTARVGETARTPKPPLRAACVVVGLVVVGFTFGYLVGVQPWVVAAIAVAVLALLAGSRSPRAWLGALPWRSAPLGTAVTVVSLGVLASAAAAHFDLGSLLRGHGPLHLAQDAALAGAAANVINNLPALLASLAPLGHHPSPSLWAVLVGVNMGPVMVVSGSLASLLWLATVRRLGVEAGPGDFTRYGLRAGLPGALAGVATLVLLTLVGGG